MILGLIAKSKTALASVSAGIWRWLIRVFLGPGFFEIAVEFFTEATVLVAVFPILDTIIERAGKVTRSLMVWSEGLAAIFVILAGILSELAVG